IGFFVNTLALRLELGGEPTVGDWLATVRRRVLEAQSHQDVPFEQVVEVLKPERSLAHHPVFQLMFAWQNAAGAAPALDGLMLEALPDDGAHGTQFELTLSLREEPNGAIAGVLGYATALYERATVERHLAALRSMLAGMGRDDRQAIERIELLDQAQRQQLLVAWNDAPCAAAPAVCVHQLFERQALRTPTAVAVEQDGRRLTYRQMNAQANRLAHRLAADGVRPGAAVAVLLARSMLLVVAQLAILKCGAFYVPLDLEAPAERQAALIADCGAVVVLTSRQRKLPEAAGWRRLDLDATPGAGQGVAEVDAPNWHAAWPSHNPDLKADPEAIAYVMYTSGSTGMPKGVMVPHRAIARVVVDNGYAAFDGGDRVAFAANPAFDAATMDVWAPLLNGGRLVVVDAATLLAPERLARLLKERRITAMFLTTALFNQYARAIPEALAGLRYLMCGGERADPAAFARLLAQGGPQHLVHCYGPTETTTFATTCEISAGFDQAAPLPIGRPIADTRVYLLDRLGQLVPPGAVGEIHIGGAGVARGYL
ncbi:non-ribosomal peptide synthetase, partial [Rugamonas rubra]